MDFENLFIIFLTMIGCAIILVAEMINDNIKEIELIKNTKEYVIYQNCKNLDGEWYCYD